MQLIGCKPLFDRKNQAGFDCERHSWNTLTLAEGQPVLEEPVYGQLNFTISQRFVLKSEIKKNIGQSEPEVEKIIVQVEH